MRKKWEAMGKYDMLITLYLRRLRRNFKVRALDSVWKCKKHLEKIAAAKIKQRIRRHPPTVHYIVVGGYLFVTTKPLHRRAFVICKKMVRTKTAA